jgi:hypothetical protein
MDNREAFAHRIRERYPEGLTGVFAIGGTRTTYILDQNRDQEDPGKIEDFATHGEYLLRRYFEFAEMFYSLGGQNMIITAFSFRGFYNRGREYAEFLTQELARLQSDYAAEACKRLGIDPYFTGIDTLLLFSEDSPVYHLGRSLQEFQREWDYQEGRKKLIWEVASIPLYSFWQTSYAMSRSHQETLAGAIESNRDELEAIYRTLYEQFSYDAYGTKVPMPHFYLGTNKSGDLKWRSPMPLALSGGDYLRMFFTPYPTLFLTAEIMQTILEDLAFNERFFSDKTDYKGKYTRALAQAEYERVMNLRKDPNAVLGLSRHVNFEDES